MVSSDVGVHFGDGFLPACKVVSAVVFLDVFRIERHDGHENRRDAVVDCNF